MSEIIFIGGIHGSGKGTFCAELCKKIGATHLTASELLKWGDVSEKNTKLVIDIPAMQTRLINGLKNTIKKDHRYILDGHFCLLDKNSNISRIDINVFQEISPSRIYVLVDNIEVIAHRLFMRDGIIYDKQILHKMQEQEERYGKKVADYLNIKYTKIETTEIHNLTKSLR